MTRREMFRVAAASLPLLAAAPSSLFSAEDTSRRRLGVGAYSYSLHWKSARDGKPNGRFKDALEFLDYCHGLGAGGVQVAVGSKDLGYAAKVRAVVGLSVPAIDYIDRKPSEFWARTYPDKLFYQTYFWLPGPAEAELEADP